MRRLVSKRAARRQVREMQTAYRRLLGRHDRFRFGVLNRYMPACCGEPRRCHDCDANIGEYHLPGCDAEQCPICGWQVISCGCIENMGDMAFDAAVRSVGGYIPHDGYFMGEQACVVVGWYSRWVSRETGLPVELDIKTPGKWVPCRIDDAGAGPDVNRIASCSWNRDARRFEVPT